MDDPIYSLKGTWMHAGNSDGIRIKEKWAKRLKAFPGDVMEGTLQIINGVATITFQFTLPDPNSTAVYAKEWREDQRIKDLKGKKTKKGKKHV